MSIDGTNSAGSSLEYLTGTDFAGLQIGAKIGAGGYAWVFRAIDLKLDRDVAIKILLPRAGGYPAKLRERFEREAKLVAKLRDARTIDLIKHGECDGLLFIVFEFIDGLSLDVWLNQNKSMGALLVAKVLEQVLESLADAHSLGILHRDIKPGNIMLYEIAGRADQVKVLDFGIGKFVNNKQALTNLTREGSWLGTPRYMSPEQMSGGTLNGQSDIYSLGLVAYELITGSSALKRTDDAEEAIAEITSNVDLRVPADAAPSGLVDIVNKMLRKDLSRRYGSANEVLKDLQALTRLEDLSGEKVMPDASASSIRSKKLKWKRVAAIALGLVIIACAIVMAPAFFEGKTNDERELGIRALMEPTEEPAFGVPTVESGPGVLSEVRQSVDIAKVAVHGAVPAPFESVEPVEAAVKPVESKPVVRRVRPKSVAKPVEVVEVLEPAEAVESKSVDEALSQAPVEADEPVKPAPKPKIKHWGIK